MDETTTTPGPFELEKRIGTMDTGYRSRAVVTIEASWDGTRLSMTGTAERPRAADIDAGGQMQDDVAAMAPDELEIPEADRDALVFIWRLYHLNDLSAGCEHQRAAGWTYDEHPAEPCPVCDYKMGTAWLTAPVPADVLERLRSLMGPTAPGAYAEPDAKQAATVAD